MPVVFAQTKQPKIGYMDEHTRRRSKWRVAPEARTLPGEGVALTSLGGIRPNAAADNQRSTVETKIPNCTVFVFRCVVKYTPKHGEKGVNEQWPERQTMKRSHCLLLVVYVLSGPNALACTGLLWPLLAMSQERVSDSGRVHYMFDRRRTSRTTCEHPL